MIRGRRLLNIKKSPVPSLLESVELAAVLFICSESSAASAKRPLQTITDCTHALNGASHGSRTKSVHKCQYCDHSYLQYLLILKKHLQRPVNNIHSHSKGAACAGRGATSGDSLLFYFSLSAKIKLLIRIFCPCCEPMGLSLLCRPVTSEPSSPSLSAELSKAPQARRYVLQDPVRQLVAQAKALSSTKESQGIQGLSTHSYGNYFLWWAPKNPIPELFTNLSQFQGANTSLSQNSSL